MKRSYIIFGFTFISILSQAQVGIGTITPDASSVLDISATDKGVLIPQVALGNVTDTTLDAANAAATGLLIYNTNASTTGGSGVGYYFFNGTAWERLITTATSIDDADWYIENTTTKPNDINDEIYTLGKVAIGKNTADWPLDLYSNIGGRGMSILMAGADNITTYGLYSEVTNSGDLTHFGNYNLLSGGGTGVHLGNYNMLTGTGVGTHYGTYNILNGDGGGVHTGTFNSLLGTGTNSQIGVWNKVSNSNNNFHYGVYNEMDGSGSGSHYGIFNEISGVGNGIQRGVYSSITNSGSNPHYGVYSSLSGAGTATKFGTYNNISASSGGLHYGVYSTLTGMGAGTKFGSYNIISSTAGGTHYGVYSSATKGGSYAGYFVGDVYVSGIISFASDQSLKQNIHETSAVLEKLNKIKVQDFSFKTDLAKMYGFPTEEQTGYIAQEMELLFPNLVKNETLLHINENDSEPSQSSTFKSVNYIGMVPILTKAIQEQQAQIETQQAEIDELKNEIQQIKEMLQKQ